MMASEEPAVAVPITLPSLGAFQRSPTAGCVNGGSEMGKGSRVRLDKMRLD